jgi:hypothetical protein
MEGAAAQGGERSTISLMPASPMSALGQKRTS